jgi:hypothetical protein
MENTVRPEDFIEEEAFGEDCKDFREGSFVVEAPGKKGEIETMEVELLESLEEVRQWSSLREIIPGSEVLFGWNQYNIQN